MKALRLISAVLLTLLISAGAEAQTAQKHKKARLEREIRVLEERIRENAKSSSNAMSKAKLMHSKVEARKALVQESDLELAALSDTILLCRNGIEAAREKLDTMEAYYGRLVRTAYRNRDSRMWFMYILASEDLGQGARRFGYLRSLSERMNRQAGRIREQKAELEAKQAHLDSLYRDARTLREERAYEMKKLQKEENESLLLVKQLQKDKSKYQNQIADKKKQVDALNREIERIISSAVGDKDASRPGKDIDYKLSSRFEENQGKLPWPVEGAVTDRFGEHYHPVYKTVKLPFNNGITIAVGGEAQVRAVFDGVVRQIIVMPGYNQCVLVQHGEYFTFYCKLGGVSVKAGDKIKTGQVVGRVANIGGENQLHFQLWKGKKPQDPELWLR